MDVGELCNREVVICQPDRSLLEAAQLMREHHVGSLVVIDPARPSEPIGVVTDRDLVVYGIAAGLDTFTSRTVAQVMARELVMAREHEDIATILSRMTSFGVRRVPVVDDVGRLQGILAYDDLIEWMAEQLGRLTRVVRSELRVEQRRFNADDRGHAHH